MADTQLSRTHVITRIARAIRKAHTRGQRGLEMVTHDEILALIGMVPDLSAEALMTFHETGNPK